MLLIFEKDKKLAATLRASGYDLIIAHRLIGQQLHKAQINLAVVLLRISLAELKHEVQPKVKEEV